MRTKMWCVGLLAAALSAGPALAQGAGDRDARIERLERLVEELSQQVQNLKAEQAADKVERIEYREEISSEIDSAMEMVVVGEAREKGGFDIGGYGEIHANFSQGKEKDLIDIHRFVLDFTYNFEDWIVFRSELEFEHAFISDADGEVSLEQFYTDFLFSDRLNLRIGRFLTPMGIINQHHEPTLFNGVERPNVDKYIIPTTWSSDGIGIFGKLTKALTYEAYLANGLDGSKFDPIKGIRGGRIKERPSLNDLAVMGRVDYYPFVDFPTAGSHALRLGLSGYMGGLDNGDEGKNPGLSGPKLTMLAADFEYSFGKLDFRGEGAYQWIDDADELPAGVAEEMAGWYLESAYHAMPESWKKGRLSRSDAVLFLRYEDFDTQLETVSGVARVPGGDRQEWTTGINFYFTPSIVLKADYQFVESDAASDPENRFNLGMGMQF